MLWYYLNLTNELELKFFYTIYLQTRLKISELELIYIILYIIQTKHKISRLKLKTLTYLIKW